MLSASPRDVPGKLPDRGKGPQDHATALKRTPFSVAQRAIHELVDEAERNHES